MNIDKTLKLAKKLLKFIKILIIINIVVSIVMLLFTLLPGFKEADSLSTSLTLGILKLSFKEPIADEFISYSFITLSCLIVTLLTILWYLITTKLEIIVDNAIKGEIFSSSSTRSLNLISLYILIHGVINLIITLMASITVNKYIFSLELFNSAIVDSVTVNNSYDISFLAISFIIYILAKVFAYGEELQKLSDETL